MTPTWVPLLVAAVGLAGILWTQRAADRRAERDHLDAQRRRQDEVLQQQLEWERNQRVKVHAMFLTEQWRAEHMWTMYNQVGSVSEPAPDWTEPMARQLVVMQIFARSQAYVAARALLQLTTEMSTGNWGVGRYPSLDAAKDRYIDEVRNDLGITLG